MDNKAVAILDEHGDIIETEPQEEKLPATINLDNLAYLEQVAEGMDRYVAAQNRIASSILKLAKPGDWVIFEKKTDQGKESTACLSGAGAERIAAALGINFVDWTGKKEEGKDDNGNYYWWWHKCKARFGKREIEVEGRAGTRDKFFGREHGQWKAVSDVDEGNIRIASRRNCMKEGVKVLLGLRNLPLEELQKANIQLVYGRTVTFEKKQDAPQGEKNEKKENPADEEAKREELAKILLKLTNGDPIQMIDYTKQFSKYKSKAGHETSYEDYKKLTGWRLDLALKNAKEYKGI